VKNGHSDDNLRRLVFIAELWQGDQMVAWQTAFFAPIKHLALSDPKIAVELHAEKDQLIVDLASHSLALLVEVSLNNADVIFSDNYFNMPAGGIIHITCPMPAGYTLERAKVEFHVRSVYDSYSH